MDHPTSFKPETNQVLCKLPQLAGIRKKVFWTEKSGVIVSPNCQDLPKVPSPTDTHKDPGIRHIISDSTIYEIFYPRLIVNRGELFGRLDVTNSQLYRLVVEIPSVKTGLDGGNKNSTFILPENLIRSWTRLENALVETASYLLRSHENSHQFHPLTMPRLPWQYGYRDFHSSRVIATRCAAHARDAFAMLGAVVTFTLSLWLRMEKSACFEDAFTKLHIAQGGPQVPVRWLHMLEESYLCNLSAGMRTGGFLDPYETTWGRFIPAFVAAGVPMWFVWGHHLDITRNISNVILENLLPDNNSVNAAMMKSKRKNLVISYDTDLYKSVPNSGMAFDEYHPYTNDNFDETNFELPPLLYSQYAERSREQDGVEPLNYTLFSENAERGSGQKHGEWWENFFDRKAKELKECERTETSASRNARLVRLSLANKGRWDVAYSVYEWQLEGTFWRRTRVEHCDIERKWDRYTENQRRYTSHTNQWDLCPQIPPDIYEEDPFVGFDDSSDVFAATSSGNALSVPDDQFSKSRICDSMEEDMRNTLMADDSGDEDTIVDVPSSWDFLDFLVRRYGFKVSQSCAEQPSLHDKNKNIAVEEFSKVYISLCYMANPPPNPQHYSKALVEFHNTIINPQIRLRSLAPSWDISPNCQEKLLLSRKHFTLNVLRDEQNLPLYVIRPIRCTYNDCVVATYESTTLLLAFRLPWSTLDDLVRQLLRRNVGFYMPRYIENRFLGPPLVDKGDSHGLGWRPIRYKPTRDDYPAYLREKKGLLRSGHGRRCRLTGGIVGRLSRNLVTEEDVLQGPTYCDLFLAKAGDDAVLAEDDTPAQILDIVCGVYHVGNTHENLSWWPKATVWKSKSGMDIGEWTPDAEHWYQKHLDDICLNGTLHPSRKWREHIKKFFSKNRLIMAGYDRLAEEYIFNAISNNPSERIQDVGS